MNVISEFNFVKGEAYQHCTCIICPAFKSLMTSKNLKSQQKAKINNLKSNRRLKKSLNITKIFTLEFSRVKGFKKMLFY